MTRLLMLAVLLLFQPAAAWAQQGGRKVALIIANSNYAQAGSLANPANDARLIADSARRAGFDSVVLAPNLGLTAFQRALRDFRAQAQGAQVAMVYYAGHGIEGGGKNWLIPVDAGLSSDLDLPYEAIDLDRVMEALSGARVRMVVLDACRNNPFGRSWRSGSRAVNRGLAQIDADDVLVIYAAAPGQTASDGTGGNSPFATSLARRLAQPDLPIQLLGGAVRDDVLASTGGEQRPFVSASITGTPVYLVATAPAAAPAQATAPPPPTVDTATLDALTWQGAVNANSASAFAEYKQQFPQGRFARLADENIARLNRPAPAPSSAAAPPPIHAKAEQAGQAPSWDSAAAAPRGPQLLIPDSSTRPVDRARLSGLSAAQLRIARNEIFARHGFVFQSADLRSHFSGFPWYRPVPGQPRLSQIEQANVRLIQQEEQARGAGH